MPYCVLNSSFSTPVVWDVHLNFVICKLDIYLNVQNLRSYNLLFSTEDCKSVCCVSSFISCFMRERLGRKYCPRSVDTRLMRKKYDEINNEKKFPYTRSRPKLVGKTDLLLTSILHIYCS